MQILAFVARGEQRRKLCGDYPPAVARALPARTRVTCRRGAFRLPPSFLSRLKVLHADYHTRDTSRKDLHRLHPTCVRGMHPCACFPRRKPSLPTLSVYHPCPPPRLKITRHRRPSIKSGRRYTTLHGIIDSVARLRLMLLGRVFDPLCSYSAPRDKQDNYYCNFPATLSEDKTSYRGIYFYPKELRELDKGGNRNIPKGQKSVNVVNLSRTFPDSPEVSHRSRARYPKGNKAVP